MTVHGSTSTHFVKYVCSLEKKQILITGTLRKFASTIFHGLLIGKLIKGAHSSAGGLEALHLLHCLQCCSTVHIMTIMSNRLLL